MCKQKDAFRQHRDCPESSSLPESAQQKMDDAVADCFFAIVTKKNLKYFIHRM